MTWPDGIRSTRSSTRRSNTDKPWRRELAGELAGKLDLPVDRVGFGTALFCPSDPGAGFDSDGSSLVQ
jgi:hypothetical protein